MTTTINTEYRTLERESSNDLIRHDARRGDGKYAEAAWHALQAGHGRRRMGILKRDAGEFTYAAEDWLSASACFYLATNPNLLRAGIEKVRELDQAGHIPPERPDLHEAFQEREKQLETLERRLTEFVEEYTRRFGSATAASQERCEFLQKHVREFPGFARLHYALYQQARELGNAPFAAEHLHWAAEFAPEEPEYVGRHGYQLITSGQPGRAAEIARWFLKKQPNEPSIRVMLAQALASQTGGQKPDRNAAIQILQEILTDENANVNVRLAAVTLSGALRRDMGEEAEAKGLLALFDQLAMTIHTPASGSLIAAFREIFTRPVVNGNGSNSEERAITGEQSSGLEATTGSGLDPGECDQSLTVTLPRILYPSDEKKSLAA
jgi:hypothetical protein